MTETMPQNAEEAAYAAFAMIDELINLLADRNVLDPLSLNLLFESVAKRLSQESNFASNRAAHFVADRMSGKE